MFLDMTFLTLDHAANTWSRSDSHPSGNCGFCQNTEILMYRHQQCGAFAALEKRAKCAAAGSSEVLQEEEEAVVSKHV